jgi:hypothetical protein
MTLEKSHLKIVFTASYISSILSVIWLFTDKGYEPLIASIACITLAVGSTLAYYKKKCDTCSEYKMIPSPLTPNSPILDKLMAGAIETVCRGVSVPQTPESADLSAFIFQKKENELVCTHHWSPNPRQEQVGVNKFELREDLLDKVAVVKAAFEKKPNRTPVTPIPEGTEGVEGKIDPTLNYVLAAPILNKDKSLWGVVDFDSGNEAGKTLLMNTVSDSVMYNLAEHLRLIFSLTENEDASVNKTLNTV